MPAESKKLNELSHDTLKDIYYAENKILEVLPKMARAARHAELKAAFPETPKANGGARRAIENGF